MGPEDNPADDAQPTKEEYEAWEEQQKPAKQKPPPPTIRCPNCDDTTLVQNRKNHWICSGCGYEQFD